MLQYHIWTIGCQMNRAESERLGACLEQMGYQPAADAEGADIVIVNSCVVRQNAEEKVTNRLHALGQLKQLRPSILVALTGCLVDSNIEQLKKDFPHIDRFFKPGEIPDFLANLREEELPLPQQVQPATFVSIIQGCNNFCSYCIVPYRRGRERSRSMSEIACEVRELVRRGAKEVTLLGQNVDSYGHDLPEKPDLAGLLHELNAIEGLARIRFLTNHPKDMSLKLIKAIAGLDKVCKQLNLPVQAGSDDVLKLMRRGYTAAQYRELVTRIREEVPEVAISTDVIVGFPTETESRFLETFDLLQEVRFDIVHVAVYSPRPGTIAARELEDDVPQAVKKERLDRVEQLQAKVAAEINSQLTGKTVEVLVEGKKRGKWWGRTRSGKLVFFTSNDDCYGKLLSVTIEQTTSWSLQGRLVQPEIKEEMCLKVKS